MNKFPIAIYLQHYLAPSMTFIYRQLKSAEKSYTPIVLCSDKMENTDKFPFDKIYFKQRNFLKLKKSRIIGKVRGWHKLLSTDPKLSGKQKFFFTKILNQFNIRLIHAHFGPAGLEVISLANQLKLPLLVTFHGYDASMLLRFDIYKAKIKQLFDSAVIITVSQIMKDELIALGADPDRTFVVRCGIPVEQFRFVQRPEIVEKIRNDLEIKFLQVSNFVEKKGHEFTIKAFNNYLGKNSNAKLILAGDGRLKKQMLSLCSELGILQKVDFTGGVSQEEVFKLMEQADIFLHHSVTSKEGDKEGIPTVIMEAMATGLPVISTIHSGIPELIDNYKNGILIPEKDITQYTQVLNSIENWPKNIGLNAREEVIVHYNLSVETGKLFSIYDKLLANSGL